MVTMALSTAFTDMFGIRHPIALAPMGGSAGGALAAAVSNGGGLGLLGGGPGDQDWLARELPLVAEATTKPWGIGFQSWAIEPAVVESALRQAPAALMLSFGDPRPFTRLVRQAGVPLFIQVTEPVWASQAIDLIHDLPSAADLVGLLAAQAEEAAWP
jgi:nitronate monooxygenase